MNAVTQTLDTEGAVATLRGALFGPGADESHGPYWRLLSTEAFRRVAEATPERRLRDAYERLRLLNGVVPDPLAFVADPARLAAVHESLGFVDPTLTSAATIHYNLFLGSLVDEGTFSHEELAPFAAMRQVGTFLVTEVAHGNDVAAVETTATYDRVSDSFLLHTPSAGAQKFMPNASPVGGPKTGLVAARLLVDGVDEGVFLFLVRLTDATGTLPGVRVRRLPPRLGSPFDHCLTSFDQVRVERRALLGGTHARFEAGRFSCDTPRGQRYLRALRRVMVGKLCMSACAVGGARAVLSLAVRYGQGREISGLTGTARLPVFALRSHHGPLVEALATTYAMNMLYREAVSRWQHDGAGERREDAARLVSAAKAWITWRGREIGAEARERCGAQGLLVHNGIADQLAAVEGTITAEGDNQATMSKVAAELVLEHRAARHGAAAVPGGDLTRPEVAHGLLRAARNIWLDRAVAGTRQAPPGALARRNGSMGPALRAADLHVHRQAAEALARAAAETAPGAGRELLESLHLLFALRAVAEHSGDLLAQGLIAADQVERLPLLREALITRIARHARTLVDAFAVPEAFFAGIPIASADYVTAYDDPEGPWHTPPRQRRR
ncbi:acyl-CoA dehydrogenase family protein [Streptomyces millisiae]|uniref:acyl-CoA dehydrogenase family protein n=1 Tax=Streptomyces millisiae TaxID=3075542 RepID=UPI00374E1690